MRKMATIRRIDQINPIPNADAIEVATVGGWRVVVKRGEFQTGDLAIYCEIDSFIPTSVAPFLTKPGHHPKTFEDVDGERLRTVRLRGQLSQGLLLPYAVLPFGSQGVLCEGDDVSELLGIAKWEAPVPAQLAGEARGMFPSFVRKTDQERVQNLSTEFLEWVGDVNDRESQLQWEVTEKLDGSSMTVYVNRDDLGVCSRNLNLLESEGNTYWRIARSKDLIAKILSTGRNIALQGELIGEGIQGNPYKISGQDFYLFDIYDIDTGEYMLPQDRQALARDLDIQCVPIIAHSASLYDGLGIKTVDAVLGFAEGASTLMNKTEREGVVFKCSTQQLSFKAISNAFLLREK
jgi:RNA ligase (TIGR02306 family)